MACEKPQTLITFATLLGPLVIIFVSVGFATDYWTETKVDRDDLTDIEKSLSNTNQEIARIFHTRHRGIIRECYPEDSALFLKEATNVVSRDCFYVDFDDPEGQDMSDDYKMRMDLIRAVLATYVLGIVAIILTFIMGLVLCLAKSCHLAHAASISSCVGGLFVLASIVLFHAQGYMEANKDGNPGEILFHSNWSKTLLKATDSELGYSYALAWCGFVLALLDGVLYVLVSRALRLRELADDTSSLTSSSSGQKTMVKAGINDGTQIYDNYGMKFSPYPAAALPAAMPGSMFVEGYPPSFMHTMAATPTMDYGNSHYRNGGSHNDSREA